MSILNLLFLQLPRILPILCSPFISLNGDGRDDYIYVDPESGDILAWINQLQNADGVWQWESIGTIARGFSDDVEGIPKTEDALHMVDIDGEYIMPSLYSSTSTFSFLPKLYFPNPIPLKSNVYQY